MEELRRFLDKIEKETNVINGENIDARLKNINSIIKHVNKRKLFLKDKLSETEYKHICDAIHTRVKQIVPKFDSIIETRLEEQKILSSQLSKTVIQKKLINYQR